jgi:hypothetical protein
MWSRPDGTFVRRVACLYFGSFISQLTIQLTP